MATYSTGLRPIRLEMRAPGIAASSAAMSSVTSTGIAEPCASFGAMPWAFSR